MLFREGEDLTARATFSQATIARAIRAAEACGKVAVMTPQGIVFAQPDQVALPSQEEKPMDADLIRWGSK